MNLTITFNLDLEDDDGAYSETVTIPAKFAVCEACEGRGAQDGFPGGFSANDEFVDDDFLEDYHQGVYDVACDECHGRNVVLVPDEARCDHPSDVTAYYRYLQVGYDYAAEVAAERRMGA